MLKTMLVAVLAVCTVWALPADRASASRVVVPGLGTVHVVKESDGVPLIMNLQGYVTDVSGNPVPDSEWQMTFRIYRENVKWEENQTCRTTGGLFSVSLGQVVAVPESIFRVGAPCSLQVTFASTVFPKVEMTSVGYAYRSSKSDTAEYARTAPPSQYADSAGGSIRVGGLDVTGLDGRYVNEGQANSITSAMIVDGTITRTDVVTSFKAPFSDTADYARVGPAVDSARISANSYKLQGKDTTGFVRTGQPNSVTGAMIRDTTVNTADLKDGAATSAKILDGTVIRADVAAGFKAPFSDTADYARAAPASDSARVAGNSHLLLGKDTTALWNAKKLQGKDTTGFVRTGQTNSVTSAMITDGTIVNADISASADIAQSKISNSSRNIDADKLNGYHYNELPVPAHNHIGESWSSTSADLALAVKLDRSSSGTLYGQVDTILNSGSGSVRATSAFVGGTGTGDRVGANYYVWNGYGGKATGGSFTGDVRAGSSDAVGLQATGVAFGSSSGGALGIQVSAQNSSTGSGPTYGLWSQAGHDNSGAVYAVYAKRSGGGDYAGYFDGNVHVTGTLSKGSGSFLIDHPQDPLNKTLRHNFVESPENLCLYRGTVSLGDDGSGTVEMPSYFAALTKEQEATVTLTPVGRPFGVGYEWNPDHTAFTAYGEAGREVSYIVLADRDDPVMRKLRRPVEEDKGSGNFERGKLLYPAAYGYPASMGVSHDLDKRSDGGPSESGSPSRTKE
ncbi:MAG: hypothetical protein NTX53_06265 [candidate division WOR-3 bacterium]|nr:hypothetical protein [candidate division WOR-3 bacterium]